MRQPPKHLNFLPSKRRKNVNNKKPRTKQHYYSLTPIKQYNCKEEEEEEEQVVALVEAEVATVAVAVEEEDE